MMQIVCASCKRVLGYMPGPHGQTHGICKLCGRKARREYARLMARVNAPDDSVQARELAEYVEANQ